MLSETANALVRLLLAPACASCHAPLVRPLDGAVCAACWTAVPRLTPPLCDLCGDSLPPSTGPFRVCLRCLEAPPGFEVARSAGIYAGSLRAAIHAFKFERRRTLAAPLAALMSAAGAEVLVGADAVVPVPLHPWRAVHRGFNQSDDLARHIGLPVWRILRRSRHGPPQSRLSGRDRRSNVERAFARRFLLSMATGGPPADRLRRSTVVLIDDVMTTGATLDACSRVLAEAGVGSVRALTAARALTPRHASHPHSRLPSAVRHR